MQFTRAAALAGFVGISILVVPGACVGAYDAALLPIVPKGADIPKDPPEPETFVVFDAGLDPDIFNEVTNGTLRGISGSSFGVRGAAEFTLLDSINMDFELAYKRYSYKPIQDFTALDSSVAAHVNMQVSPQKVYAGLGYISLANNYAFPRIGGLGAGIGKLPMLDRRFSLSGSLWFYPNVIGTCGPGVCDAPQVFGYSAFDYDMGAVYALRSRLFLNAGFNGDHLNAKWAPSNIEHSAAYAGLGLHL